MLALFNAQDEAAAEATVCRALEEIAARLDRLQLARSAGTSVQFVAREGAYSTLRLRSGEMRKVLSECRATLGEVSNGEHSLRSLGKAGAKRWRGVRPTVRGVAMNPVDHPHGGGEGRTSGGRHPVSPWGMPTKGYKTRTNKRTDNLIVRRRNKR